MNLDADMASTLIVLAMLLSAALAAIVAGKRSPAGTCPTRTGGANDNRYRIHLERPYKHARHYLGYTADLEARIEQHRNGTGARLLQVITAAGIALDVACTWAGGRRLSPSAGHSAWLCARSQPSTPRSRRRMVSSAAHTAGGRSQRRAMAPARWY